MKKRIILVLLIACVGLNHSLAQFMPRGANPGELYVTYIWYHDLSTSKRYDAIFFTQDFGRHFTPLHTFEWNSNEVPVGNLHADASPGIIYNYTVDGLYRSFDNVQTWEMLDEDIGPYVSISTGNIQNEVFKVGNDNSLYKSINNGEDWELKHENMTSGVEVGTQPGELYTREVVDFSPLKIEIGHSSNDGIDFTFYDVESIISGYMFSGYMAGISRGNFEGELYLISWWFPANYKIFRSNDHGQSFALQYEQPDTCYFWDENYYFTAGRGECEFYIIKAKNLVNGYYTRLHVYHSADCAQTFTEYIHELTPDYNGNPAQIIYTIAASPNPAESGEVTGAGYYNEGDEVNLSATPHEGYTFQNWTENGIPISDESELIFTADSTRTLKANFQLINNITFPESAGISLYPNPASGFVTVNFQQFRAYSNVAFEIFRIDGRKLLSKPIHSELSTHDISNLPTGMYLYRFTADGLMIKTGKLIIH